MNRHDKVFVQGWTNKMASGEERKERLEKLGELFPITMKKLRDVELFTMVIRQMEIQGYLDWEIIQAACNLVARYRVDPNGSLSAGELAVKMRSYLTEYHETELSPFPPSDFFTKRRVREQVIADRAGRMSRIATPKLGTLIERVELEHQPPQPKNIQYSRQEDFHGWKILFYDLESGKPIEDVFVQVITEDKETGFEVAENLAEALASDAGLIWNWLNKSGIKNHEPVVITVYEESSFSKLFPKAHEILVSDNQLTDSLPVAVGAARKKNGTLGVRIVTKNGLGDTESERIGTLVLMFALGGALHLWSEIEQGRALEMSGAFVDSL